MFFDKSAIWGFLKMPPKQVVVCGCAQTSPYLQPVAADETRRHSIVRRAVEFEAAREIGGLVDLIVQVHLRRVCVRACVWGASERE